MVLPDVKALKELLKLLRSQGVTRYNTPELELTLSENMPNAPKSKSQAIEDIMGEEELSSEEEAERILFYSATSPLDQTPPEK